MRYSLFVLAAVSAFMHSDPSFAQQTVTVAAPTKRTLERKLQLPAFVYPFEETPLFAKIAGHVRKVHVDIGDAIRGPKFDGAGKEIEPGQLLAELWIPEYEEELKQKQALVAQAKAEVEQADATLAATDAHVDVARAQVRDAEAGRKRALANFQRWQSEFERIETLVKQKVIDNQIRDETRNQFQSAAAARDEVEAKVMVAEASQREAEAKKRKAQADVAAARSRVQVAQAEEGRMAALLTYAQIRAPYDGLVTKRNIHTGHFLQPSATGSPLFVVMHADIVRVVFDVPETDAALIRKGLAANLRVAALPNREFAGTVSRTAWSLDPRARTLRTEIDLVNDKQLLRPGMYAYVHLAPSLPDLMTLPLSAVVAQGGDQGFCFIVQDGKVRKLPVKLGARSAAFVEVTKKLVGDNLWEPLAGTEAVVTSSLTGLSEGQDVIVEKK